ncbi:Phosphoheptose isomerase [Georgfuchsia toluolica]|uniref:Ubiquinone biosynthesis accessory factor UbiK n=1 Tax=Georgfuchsia toluolica TaxID=424218 RepID=A0A916J500_9PROT|nr:accessory factor UbiK family protein [Georgfuchsia toluolica]CAG4884057.1 Phosphoheptose isomerase [Georgfuchsia toluolica]
MTNNKFLDEISSRISQLAVSTPVAEFEKNAKALLSGAFSRMDLVTREEFDIQRELLAKAQEKLAALEAKISELEARK